MLAHMEEKENIIMALLTLKTCFKPPLKKKKKKPLGKSFIIWRQKQGSKFS